MLLAMYWNIREYKSENHRKAKLRLLLLLMSYGIQAVGYILEVTKVLEVSKYFDLTMPGALIGTIFIADSIEYGEFVSGERNQGVAFSLKALSEDLVLQQLNYTKFEYIKSMYFLRVYIIASKRNKS